METLLPALLAAALQPAMLGLEWDYTLRNVVLGSAILGAVGGALGSFAVLRRQGLLGDALAHAALPGVTLAFMLTGAKGPLPLMAGAALSSWLGTLALLAIVRASRVKEDAALGIVLSVFFGFGILLLTRVQHSGDAAQSGLDRFLFGQAATLLARDVRTMAILGTITAGLVWLLFKEFKLVSFDPDFAATIGFAPTPVSVLLTSLIVVAVVIGLQTVGVVLMVAMLVAPAAAARQWTNRLGTMILLAAGFGALAGVSGAVISSRVSRVPTGPTIVLVATAIVAVSILVAPERGVLWAEIRQWRRRRRILLESVLRDLARLGGVPPRAVGEGQLVMERGGRRRQVVAALRALARRGLVAPMGNHTGAWKLTAAGAAAAERAIRREQLWKLALAHQLDLPVQAVHLSADEVESVLPPDLLRELDPEPLQMEGERIPDHRAISRASRDSSVRGVGGDR